MTRAEFIEDINSFYDLIDFCRDYECSYCDDIYDEDARDEAINEELMDWARDNDWQQLYILLDNIPTGYEYYHYTDGEWYGLDDGDIDDWKDDVLEWGDDNEIWEDDEEEPPEDDFQDEDDGLEVEPEPISIGELFGVCNSQLHRIGDDEVQSAKAEDEAFTMFVTGHVTITEVE